ncbi:Integral membrane protein SED5 [Coemansia sp. RSA 1807]|nr:Integral membrane protein SED5 [Coemansia sp. RSA 551]KAJ2206694.1 t-SNARE affecting a late Golgi compartment protein 2 [Coemansia sp. RSA 520]KAJ2257065.1 Integral membrane protein SED5 [Coemansia sp. RSA 454]KAJ2407688.1 Integral membrane protein SED5 [Coemansia sp. RSA 2526]KAJ2422233.1 t-SNARE affecting a late Golgi compartment protein 2 [Coemansia sp. RSA 2522]KAJ2530072.1 Integral membrane protein SED5 [Coemansia sp. RSA 1935]KAJ2547198.1 Integral membrane protein SED5 [Coemansia sp.
MATRSRTFLFVQYRNSFGHLQRRRRTQAAAASPNAIEEEGLIERTNDDGELVIELAHLPPRWVDLVDDFGEQLEAIARKDRRLGELHKKHLLPGFDDRYDEEREIRELTQDITAQFQSCSDLVRSIAQHQVFGQEQIVGHNIQASLASRLQDQSLAFRKAQSAYMHRLSLRKDVNSDVFAVDSERAASHKFDMTLTDEQLQAVESNETAVAQREGELASIHDAIVDLAAVFGQMQEMVIDQGTMLDRIDYNVETAVVNVAAAAEELEDADRQHRGAVANKCILALGAVVIVLVIILLIKWL